MPRVTISMPVYNGANFLSLAIDSLLAQTFEDFELIISDNASSDATREICQAHARRDSRIRYTRTQYTIPPGENYNRMISMALGEYFRWAAHDDLCDPGLLAREVEILESDPSVVLAYPKVRIIDDLGEPIEDYEQQLETGSPDPCRRFGALVCVDHRHHGAFEAFGLMRTDALRRTPGQRNYARADSVLLARMSLLGRFYEIPERLFFNRHHVSRSVQQIASNREHGRSRLGRWLGSGPVPPPEWWNPAKKNAIVFPEWRVIAEYYSAIFDAPLSPWQRARCVGYLGWWLVRYWPKLARDIIFAGEQLVVGPPATVRTA